ncbi:hypothetical protein F4809DRAFT_348380 [Biscogniauxia mediterranea]|nr:hypothetical protein F4809DRAFT_348380 [Biscogniauxia mediterranea]
MRNLLPFWRCCQVGICEARETGWWDSAACLSYNERAVLTRSSLSYIVDYVTRFLGCIRRERGRGRTCVSVYVCMCMRRSVCL